MEFSTERLTLICHSEITKLNLEIPKCNFLMFSIGLSFSSIITYFIKYVTDQSSPFMNMCCKHLIHHLHHSILFSTFSKHIQSNLWHIHPHFYPMIRCLTEITAYLHILLNRTLNVSKRPPC